MGSSAKNSTTCTPAGEVGSVVSSPFSLKIVQLTQAELIELKAQANYWKGLDSQKKQLIEELRRELEQARATIKDLNQRLYGKKTEKGTAKQETIASSEKRPASKPRGQQKGSKGHGRTARPDLPVMCLFRRK